MPKYYCWYDNGTGWFEGPFLEEHSSQEEAEKKNDIGYGAYVSETDENPNDRTPYSPAGRLYEEENGH